LAKDRRPHLTADAEKQAAAKRARLAAELRANLARRKAQGRERAAAADVTDKPPGKDGGAA
jgi:hypothetical protein